VEVDAEHRALVIGETAQKRPAGTARMQPDWTPPWMVLEPAIADSQIGTDADVSRK
jgi:hypothetical protein